MDKNYGKHASIYHVTGQAAGTDYLPRDEKSELLAPAGDMTCLGALDAGADAVYRIGR